MHISNINILIISIESVTQNYRENYIVILFKNEKKLHNNLVFLNIPTNLNLL